MASVQEDKHDPGSQAEQAGEDMPQLRKSCDYCVRMKRGCDGGTPCELCNRRNKQCIRSVKKRSGPAKGTKYCKRRAIKIARSSTKQSSSSSPRAAPGRPAPAAAPAPPAPAAARSIAAAATTTTTSAAPVKAAAASSTAHRPLPSSSHSTQQHRPKNRRARPSPSKRTPAVHIKPELPRVPPPVSAIIAPDRTTKPAVLKTPSRAMVSAKLRAVDRKAAAAAAAAAAAPASTPTPTPGASQARWRENRFKAADAGNCSGAGGGGDNMSCSGRSLETDACSGSLLPFYFAPNEIMPGDGGHGDGGGRERGALGCGGGSGGIGEAHYAARTMASRRSSLEEALYGSCLKRPSFNSWAPSPFHSQPQTWEFGGKDVVGVLWNHELPSEGAEGGGGGGGAMMEQQRGCRVPDPFPPICPTSLSQPVSGSGGAMEVQQSVAMLPPLALPSAQALTAFELAGGGASAATPSLRDLLLEKWPPAPLCDSF